MIDTITEMSEPGPDDAAQEALARTITRVDAWHYRVDGANFAAAHRDGRAFFPSARVVPTFQDKRVLGFKIFHIGQKSPWAVLGFVNGDIVRMVNGKKIDTPEAAVGLADSLRDAKEVVVEIQRKNKLHLLTYSVY